MAMNLTILQGRLTRDPELKATRNGKSACSFTVAVDKKGKDAGVNFLDCVAWEGRGETISKYFKKGSQILLSGRLDQQTWEQNGVKRSKIIVVVDDFHFTSDRANNTSSRPKTPSEEVGLFDRSDFPQDVQQKINLNDIPF